MFVQYPDVDGTFLNVVLSRFLPTLISFGGLLPYILVSISVYILAKRRGIHHPWLAWLPLGHEWVFGSLADQYCFVSKQKVTNRRKFLLGFGILSMALGVYIFIRTIASFVRLMQGAFDLLPDAVLESTAMEMILSILGISLVLLFVSAVETVFYYIALNDVFASCEPEYKTLYLVLSILIPITRPILMIALCRKDKGMPPRTARPIPQTLPEDF